MCRGIESTDCTTAHAARWLLKTRDSCVLTVIHSKNPVAAGACPTDQRRWQNTSRIDTQRGTKVPRRKYSNQCMLQTGLASKTIHEPQSNVARHPGIPVSITNHPDPLLFIPLLSNYRSGTEVLARGLIGTCAQINNHDNYSPLI